MSEPRAADLSRRYEEIDAVRWTHLSRMRTSPLHYAYAKDNPQPDKQHFKLGRAIHVLVLEPEKIYTEWVVWNGGRRAGKVWEAFKEQHSGRTIVKGEEMELAEACAKAIMADPLASAHLREGLAEQIIEWTDEKTGLRCKCLVDLLNGHQVELKTTRNIVTRDFMRDAVRYGYHGQLGFYDTGIEASGYKTHALPAVVTVSTAPPHDVVVYEVQDAALDIGRRLARLLLDRLAECIASSRFPGIANGQELPFDLPEYAEWEVSDLAGPITFEGKDLLG